ncbi:MAG: OmpA family protein, partial [Pseudomonadota bacterium]
PTGWAARVQFVAKSERRSLAQDEANALYADAAVYLKIKAWASAKRLLRRIVNQYPSTNAAHRARQDLAKLHADDIDFARRSALGGPLPDPVADFKAPDRRDDDRDISLRAPDDTGAKKPVTDFDPFQWLSGEPALQDEFRSRVGDRLFFGAFSRALGTRGRKTLDDQANWLKANANVSVTIEAHADEPGTNAEDNLRWAKARAQLIKAFLVKAGLNPARLAVNVVGSSKPVALCSSAACKAQNRRVILRVKQTDEPDNAGSGRRAAR